MKTGWRRERPEAGEQRIKSKENIEYRTRNIEQGISNVEYRM